MTLLKSSKVVSVIFTLDDGTEERWTFPNGISAFYRVRANVTTENDPVKEQWNEHELHWISERMRQVKNARAEGPSVNLAEAVTKGALGGAEAVSLPEVQED